MAVSSKVTFTIKGVTYNITDNDDALSQDNNNSTALPGRWSVIINGVTRRRFQKLSRALDYMAILIRNNGDC